MLDTEISTFWIQL